MEKIITKKLSFSTLRVCVNQIGNDYQIVVEGGDKPHIGSVVLSIPRLSLQGNGNTSVTSSVLNITGHKDEDICRILAEGLSKAKNAVVVCSGGFHIDAISKEQITEVISAVKSISKELCG